MTEINLKDMVGKFVKNREGEKIFILGEDPFNKGKYVGYFQGGCSRSWHQNGSSLWNNSTSSDIISIWPEEKTYDFWANFYKGGLSGCYASQENANDMATNSRIACLHFTGTFKEGDGLEGMAL